MKTIYSKIAENRKDEFYIKTSIIIDGDKKYVKKESQNNNHLKNILNNEKILTEIYGDIIEQGSIENNYIIHPFYNYSSLEELINKNNYEYYLDLLYKLISKEENITDFKKNTEFNKIFGNLDFVDKKSLIYSNYDFTFGNILIDKDKIFKIIDCEWVFNFTIPVNMVFYKAILDFNAKHPNIIDMKKTIEKYHIIDIDKYEIAENNFQKYVLKDYNFRQEYNRFENHFDSNINYQNMNNSFIQANILNKDLNEKIIKEKETNENLNNELKNLMENYRNLDIEKENYKIRCGNYENSTTYKFMKPWWKFRDWLFPKNSRRRLYAKISKKAIRHPLWSIKHLNKTNIEKLKKYSKGEGIDRTIERIDIYQQNTLKPIVEESRIDKFDMNSRQNYPKLILPYFEHPMVSIVIPVYNQFPYTYGCIESIIKNTTKISYEVIIGDDCSTDETKNIKDYVENIIVNRNKENLRFLKNCNNAAKIARGNYIFFLNNDTNVQPNWLDSLFETLEEFPNAGLVGSKLIYPDGKLQEAGGILWKDGSAWNYGYQSDRNKSEYNYRKTVDYISGAAIMISKKLWNKLGGFDEMFVPAYCEDSDLAFMVRQVGYDVLYDPFSVVIHYEGVSNGTDLSTGVKKYQVENSKKFYLKWKNVLDNHFPNGENVFIARDRSYNKKNILVIDHYVPQFDKDAGSRTVYNYLNIFVELGYNVKFLGENFYQSEPYTTILQKKGIEVLYGPWYANNYDSWLESNGKYFDYVFMNRPHITTKFIDVVIKTCTNAKLIYYGHDLHYLRTKREYDITHDENVLKESNKWYKMEYEIYNKVDLIYYPSDLEVEEIKNNNSNLNVKVLQPYLYENKAISYNAQLREGILFVGGFRHGPNYDGIMWFINDIFNEIIKKNPDIILTIAGSYPPDELLNLKNKNINVLGFVSDEELLNLYKKTRIVIAPLRYGAGIKGKVIEAMSNGIPVLSTSCGAEGIDAKGIFVDDTMLSLNDIYNNYKLLDKSSELNLNFIKLNYSIDSAKDLIKNDFEELK